MTVIVDRPTTTAVTVPAPRAEQNPHTWVRNLSGPELALALALSDMPATTAARDRAVGGYLRPVRTKATLVAKRRLTPTGVRVFNGWVAQGVERAGGLPALWESADDWRSMNKGRTWDTPGGKTFFRRFGGQRRLNNAVALADHLPTGGERVRVRMEVSADTERVVFRLGGLYELDTSIYTGAYGAVYLMTPHAARMAAASFGLTLVAHHLGGYSLA